MAILGTNIESPRELYIHQLGAALTMENKILEILPQLEEAANDGQLQQSLRKHYTETKAHVRNLEQEGVVANPTYAWPCNSRRASDSSGGRCR